MKHYLFVCTAGKNEGEEFIVGADDIAEAKDLSEIYFGSARYICELTDYEAETSGLDEY